MKTLIFILFLAIWSVKSETLVDDFSKFLESNAIEENKIWNPEQPIVSDESAEEEIQEASQELIEPIISEDKIDFPAAPSDFKSFDYDFIGHNFLDNSDSAFKIGENNLGSAYDYDYYHPDVLDEASRKLAIPEFAFDRDYNNFPGVIDGNNLYYEQRPIDIADKLKQLFQNLKLKKDGTMNSPAIKVSIIESSVMLVPREQESQFPSGPEIPSRDEFENVRISNGMRDAFVGFGWTLMIIGVFLSCLVVCVSRKMSKDRKRKIFVSRGQLPYETLKHEEV